MNRASRLDAYPLPKVDELLQHWQEARCFLSWTLHQGYLQLVLEDNSKQFTAINTHCGLFQYNRLPFGVSSAPGIFQRAMDNLLQGMTHVATYMDDILVTAASEQEHLQNLDTVLQKLETAGVR